MYNKEWVQYIYRDLVHKNLVDMRRGANATRLLSFIQLDSISLNLNLNYGPSDAKQGQITSTEIAKALSVLSIITGQRPIITTAKTSVASWNLRKGQPTGCITRLRRDKMNEFVKKTLMVALPRITEYTTTKNNTRSVNGVMEGHNTASHASHYKKGVVKSLKHTQQSQEENSTRIIQGNAIANKLALGISTASTFHSYNLGLMDLSIYPEFDLHLSPLKKTGATVCDNFGKSLSLTARHQLGCGLNFSFTLDSLPLVSKVAKQGSIDLFNAVKGNKSYADVSYKLPLAKLVPIYLSGFTFPTHSL